MDKCCVDRCDCDCFRLEFFFNFIRLNVSIATTVEINRINFVLQHVETKRKKGRERKKSHIIMGGSVSQVFRSGSALLSNRDGKVSENTVDKIQTVFEILRANPKISMQTLEGLLLQIAKVKKKIPQMISLTDFVVHNSQYFFFSF